METMDNIIQRTCKIPGCAGFIRFRLPTKPGIYEVKCSEGHPHHIRVKETSSLTLQENHTENNGTRIPSIEDSEADNNDIETSTISLTGMPVGGKLVVIPSGIFGRFKSRSYRLHPGPNTIGRHDKTCPSDIEIYDDRFVSRRSVVIDVTECDAGYMFKMTVMKAANPVKLNGKNLATGEIIYLNYGDIILLGNTRINFIKA